MTAVERLRGGISSFVHRITLRSGHGSETRIVLRQFVDREWLAREPYLAERESRVLQLLERSAVPAPRLIAVDADGSRTGHPSVLMSFLDGTPQLAVSDPERWLRGLVTTMLEIHDVTADSDLVSWRYFTYNNVESLAVPQWTRRPEAWRVALDNLALPMPPAKEVLIHRDYHPANVLWSGGDVTGVVDWVNACVGPAGIDVGHCRRNLVELHGVEVAEQFRRVYEETSGQPQDPYFDLITAIETLPFPRVFPGWRDLGLAHLDDLTIRNRLDEYVASLVVRL